MKDLLLLLENDYKILGKLVILTKNFQNPEETQDTPMNLCLTVSGYNLG